MKALGLLLLRSGFSFLVAVWAAARIMSPEGGIPLFAVWLPEMQPDALSVQLLGGLGALLALLVLTGFFRLAAYPLLVLGLLAAAVSAWPFPAAPLDLVAGGVSPFLLHSVLALAAVAPLAFYGDDRFALDRLFVRRTPAAVTAAAEDVPSTEEAAPAAEVQATAAPSEPAAAPEPAPEAAEVPAEPQAEAEEPAVEEAVASEGPAPAPEPAAAESAEPEKSAA
ncbi:MAG: hypothetical protein CVT73_08105 [Alphaproteobacteria bacterium HGW-Alphaproteobacteria-12]|nr:MAG: hypothetical protein CVT73_08105 [Alphaproteobacteria bacterium HGW-Alphaproteobacteria-12]